MRFSRQLTHCALTFAVDSFAPEVANKVIHGDAAAANPVDPVIDHDRAGLSKGLTKAGLNAVHNYVDVFVALDIEAIDTEQVLEKLLLGALQMEQVARVMEDAEGIEFIKIDFGLIDITIGHPNSIAPPALSLPGGGILCSSDGTSIPVNAAKARCRLAVRVGR